MRVLLLDTVVEDNHTSEEALTSDILVIGSGIAGLFFCIKASDLGSINLVTKRRLTDSATAWAQGGVAAVMSSEDSIKSHVEDTLRAGAGLCHPDVVNAVVMSGPDRVRELIELGVRFTYDPENHNYELGLEGGHSSRRVLHVQDRTGQEIEEVLAAQVRRISSVQIFEDHMAINLATHGGVVVGAYVLDVKTGVVKRFAARVVVLATGGAGKVFRYTSNPDHVTGDGIAMAYRAGATVTNLEMIQFHPTILYHPKIRSFLITEALRGEGAVLLGNKGDRFMPRYHPQAELAPRDIVARAIDQEMKRTGVDHVWLDISFKDASFLKSRFPQVYENCLKAGIDITREPIPVVPGAHYVCGGVKADIYGHTDVQGLFAIGEVAGTGLHGANRLASNSLLEGLVMAHNASFAVREYLDLPIRLDVIKPWDPGLATDPDELVVISHMWDEIRSIMANYVGIVRSNKRLIRARNRLGFIAKEIEQFYWDFKITPDLIELRNIATVAELIVKMARMRRESRGAHFNIDYPYQRDETVDTVIKKGYVCCCPVGLN